MSCKECLTRFQNFFRSLRVFAEFSLINNPNFDQNISNDERTAIIDQTVTNDIYSFMQHFVTLMNIFFAFIYEGPQPFRYFIKLDKNTRSPLYYISLRRTNDEIELLKSKLLREKIRKFTPDDNYTISEVSYQDMITHSISMFNCAQDQHNPISYLPIYYENQSPENVSIQLKDALYGKILLFNWFIKSGSYTISTGANCTYSFNSSNIRNDNIRGPRALDNHLNSIIRIHCDKIADPRAKRWKFAFRYIYAKYFNFLVTFRRSNKNCGDINIEYIHGNDNLNLSFQSPPIQPNAKSNNSNTFVTQSEVLANLMISKSHQEFNSVKSTPSIASNKTVHFDHKIQVFEDNVKKFHKHNQSFKSQSQNTSTFEPNSNAYKIQNMQNKFDHTHQYNPGQFPALPPKTNNQINPLLQPHNLNSQPSQVQPNSQFVPSNPSHPIHMVDSSIVNQPIISSVQTNPPQNLIFNTGNDLIEMVKSMQNNMNLMLQNQNELKNQLELSNRKYFELEQKYHALENQHKLNCKKQNENAAFFNEQQTLLATQLNSFKTSNQYQNNNSIPVTSQPKVSNPINLSVITIPGRTEPLPQVSYASIAGNMENGSESKPIINGSDSAEKNSASTSSVQSHPPQTTEKSDNVQKTISDGSVRSKIKSLSDLPPAKLPSKSNLKVPKLPSPTKFHSLKINLDESSPITSSNISYVKSKPKHSASNIPSNVAESALDDDMLL